MATVDADADEIVLALREERVDAKRLDVPEKMWSALFRLGDAQHVVFVFLDSNEEYFLILAPINIKLKGALERTPARSLATLIRVASSVKLAKLEFFDGGDATPSFFAAVSECSTDGPTGRKLQRRMEACAKLAAAVERKLPNEKAW